MKLQEIKTSVLDLLKVSDVKEFSRKRPHLACIGDLRKKATWQEILGILKSEAEQAKKKAATLLTQARKHVASRAFSRNIFNVQAITQLHTQSLPERSCRRRAVGFGVA